MYEKKNSVAAGLNVFEYGFTIDDVELILELKC